MKKNSLLKMLGAVCLVMCVSPAFAKSEPSGGLMRHPDVSSNKIVFSYADDLWVVPRKGGMAIPLTSPDGPESYPRFSPDGSTIAFIGNYEGGSDIYSIPVVGGPTERWTFHPASEAICDWMPDGKTLLFSSNGLAGLGRQPQLFTVSLDEPLPKRLPVPYGTNASVSADGQWLAYTPHSRDTRTWKRYRGGMASDIWLFNLKDLSSKQITDFEGTDSFPMLLGDTVYYLSDGGYEHRLNIWAVNRLTGERRQLTKFKEFDCKWPSIGPGPKGKGEIVFTNGSKLYLLDVNSGRARPVKITVPGDRPRLRRQKVDASKFVQGFGISSTGKRVVLEARGDIWTAPVKNGSPRNLTATSGVAERDPAWSPDGRWIAYLSDKTGEYELYITQSDGRGETKQLTSDGSCFRSLYNWSPDSKQIAFGDKTGKLFLHVVESGETKLVDKNPAAGQITPSWSHDSAWIAYARALDAPTPTDCIWLYEIATGKKTQVTSGYFNDSSPVFDKKGDFLFFTSNRSYNSPQYDDRHTTFIYSKTEVLMAMPLRADVKNPLLPKIDEEEWKDEQKDAKEKAGDSEAKTEKQDGEESKKGDGKDAGDDADKDGQKSDDAAQGEKKPDDDAKPEEKKDDSSDDAAKKGSEKGDDKVEAKKDEDDKDSKDEKKKSEPIKIEMEGLEGRSFQLPESAGGFSSLGVNDKGNLLFGTRPSRRGAGEPEIKIIDLSADKIESKTVVSGVSRFDVSADGKNLLVNKGDKAFVIKSMPGQKLAKPVSDEGMTVLIDPREEWKQIFTDAWRLERDFFYDPTMHGVDWSAVKKHYGAMLDDCVSRRDVGFLIGEMIAELNVGHAYYRGGSMDSGERSKVGLLGCRFERDGDAIRIVELFQGSAWDVDARNPLIAAGAKEGQYLLQINDRPVTVDQNPYELLMGTQGTVISITVSDDAKLDDKDPRIAIKPMGSDSNLRFRAWIEKNRKYVADQTDGKVGYIYVVNTGVPGQNDLMRQFLGQINCAALIIDDRWNGGGQIPTRFIELLNRPVTNYFALRDGRDWHTPSDSHQGPKCMLINGMAGSGGDMFPALFRQNKLGKLIGRRTWGGLVGITGGPRLIDGASVTEPAFAYYDLDGTWGIEGHGVDPDIDVIDDPSLMAQGKDPQLDAAIDQMKKEMADKPFKAPMRPAYPDRSGFGIKDEDK